jgi:hypothetical protein
MAVDELLNLIDGDSETKQLISDEAFQQLEASDPEFVDKLIMSHHIGERHNVNASEIFDNYQTASKAYGFSGGAALDRATAIADSQVSAQYEDAGFWESELGRLKAGGLRAAQFGDAASVIFAQSKLDFIKEDLPKVQERIGSDIPRVAEAAEQRAEWLVEMRDKWATRRDSQINDYVRKQIKILKQPLSKRMREFREAEGVEGVKKLLNPLTLTEVLSEELIASTPGLAVTIGGGVIGSATGPGGTVAGAAAGAGVGEYAQGVANNFFGYLQEQGINTSDPDALESALDDSELFDSALDHAMIKSSPEAIAAALSVGAASKGKPLINALLVQPGLAGVGALGGQLIVGEDIDIKDIATEMVAELGTGSVEVGVTRLLNRSTAFKEKTLTSSGQPMNAGDFGTARESVDTEVHTEGMKPEEAFLTEKAREGDTRAIKAIERVHEADTIADAIGLNESQDFIGLSQAELNAVRQSASLTPSDKIDSQTNVETMRIAKEKGFDKNTDVLVNKVNKGAPLNAEEQMGVGLRIIQLREQRNSKLDQVFEMTNKGEDPSSIQTEVEAIDNSIDTLTGTMNEAGSLIGRAAQIRQAMINTEDFSVKSMLREATSAKGAALTDAELKSLSKLSAKIESLQSEIRRLNRMVDEAIEGTIDPKILNKLVEAKAKERIEKSKYREDIRNKKQQRKWKDSTAAGKGVILYDSVIDLARAAWTTGEFSGFLRQGLIPSAGRPITAIGAAIQSAHAAFSEMKAASIINNIEADVDFPRMKKSGLFFSDPGALSNQEVQTASRIIDKIPVFRTIVHASERNMATYLNLLRFSAMKSVMASNPRSSDAGLKAVAKYINATTGRGNIKPATASTLRRVMFSPRFTWSRLEAGPRAVMTALKHKEARNLVAKEWGGLMLGMGVMIGLASLAGLEVGDDPTSSDWGKVVIDNTRVDMWGGLQQPARLATLYMMSIGARADVVDVEKFEGLMGKDIDIREATLSFLKYKASPAVSIPWEVISGENGVGEDVGIGETAIRTAFPLYLQGAWDAAEIDGLEMGALSLSLAFFGLGVNTFERNKKKKSEVRAR